MIDAGKGNLPGVFGLLATLLGDASSPAFSLGGRGYSRAAGLKNSPGVRPINWRKAAMNAEVES